MAQHGYLHDRYDGDGFGRDDDRGRSDANQERSWRDRDQEHSSLSRDEDRSWRGREAGSQSSDHDRSSMFGAWRDQNRPSSDRHDHDRGFFDRAGSEMKSWFGDDDHRGHGHDRDSSSRGQWQDRSRQSGGWSGQQRGYGNSEQNDWGRGGRSEHSAFSSQSSQSNQNYSAHPDDHYRSWRDKQMQALDRDYQDYCREREQQFHSDFDTWRQNRQNQPQGQGLSTGSSNESLELDQVANAGGEIQGATPSPMGAATMGTNNSENDTLTPGAGGRAKR